MTWLIRTPDNASGMPPEQPRNPLDALQAQLRSALDSHLTGLSQQYDEALAIARREAAEAAERTVEERLEAARAEWAQKLDAELSAVRADADRRLVGDTAKARLEAEQQAAESLTRVRAELESALADERKRVEDAARALQDAQARARDDLQRLVEEKTQADRERTQIEAKWQQADADHQRVGSELDALRKQVEAADADRRRAQKDIEDAQQRSSSELETLRKTVASLHDERRRVDGELETERRRATGEIEQARREAAAQLQQARDQAKAQIDEAREEGRRLGAAAVPPPAEGPRVDRIVNAVREIGASHTLSEALEGLLRQTCSFGSRAAIFLINGDRLRSWRTKGFPQLDAQPFESAISGLGLLAKALQTGDSVRSGPSLPAPTFAAVPQGRLAMAVPVIVGGRAVAVLYVDNVGSSQDAPQWEETVELIARHTSSVLALLTALRTVQTLGASNGEADEQGARRYAKLLISEIKLYNEAAVKAGRERRDLLARLRPEIDRARRLYEERVPAVVGGRGQYFHQELVQTLADGDPGLLGNP